MPLQGYNIGQNLSYDCIRHTAQTTERLNLSRVIFEGSAHQYSFEVAC